MIEMNFLVFWQLYYLLNNSVYLQMVLEIGYF